jgi:hypothetical protein
VNLSAVARFGGGRYSGGLGSRVNDWLITGYGLSAAIRNEMTLE